MNCPKCTTLITKQGRFCAACGNDFGEELYERLEYYFGLKEEFKRVAALQNNLASGLKDLLRRIETYEAILNRDLAEAVVEPAEMQPEVPEPGPIEITPSGIPVSVAKSMEPEDVEPEPRPVSSRPVYTHTPESRRDSTEFEIHMGQKWLLIVGILTMVFGVGYFLKYSFEQGWVGPAGRVAMAYLWGIVFLVVGDRFRAKNLERFGLPLIGGGIAVLYFSTFAAFQLYHLFDQTASFSIMVMITVLACTLAVYYDTKWLAVMGLIGGFLTPVLLSTGQDNQIALMTYMTILNLGLLGVAFYKKWDLLNTLGFIFTYLLYTAWYAQHYQDSKFWPAILFLNVFYFIYTFVPFAYEVRKSEKPEGIGLVLMGINAFIAFGYGYAMIKGLYAVAWVSIITVLYACMFLSLATYLYRKGMQSLDVFVIFMAEAMVFLIITVPVLFSGHWITIFWAAQALGLLWMAVKLKRNSLVTGAYGLLGIAVLKFLLHDYTVLFHFTIAHGFAISGGYTYLITERYATTIVVLLALYFAGVMAKRASLAILWPDRGDAYVIFPLLAIVLFIALNVEVVSFAFDYLSQIQLSTLSVLWMLFAFGVIWQATRSGRHIAARAAYALIGLALIKFVFYDYGSVFHFSGEAFAFQAAGLVIERFTITVIVLAALYAAALRARGASLSEFVADHGDSSLLFSVFGGLVFTVLNAEVSTFFYDFLPQARFAAISVLWTLFSVVLMLIGFRKNNAVVRKISFGLFLIVVLKVFLLDMSNFSTPYRIISFIILGLMLVGTSYLYYRYKDRIITALADEEKANMQG